LATLKAKPVRNPALQATVQAQINNVNQQISDLEDLITEAKKDLADYTAAQETLAKALARYTEAQNNTKAISEKVTTYQQEYESHTDVYNKATAEYDASLTTLNTIKAELQAAEDALSFADASLTSQIAITNGALTELNNAKAVASQAGASVNTAQEALISAEANLSDSSSNKARAQSVYDTALTNLQEAQSAFDTAQANLQSAQNAYDTNLIPDPNWTAPTHQVAHTRLVPQTRTVTTTTLVPHETTTLQEQVIPNILFNSDFSQGNSGWSGLSIGWQNSQPGYFNGNIVFSYMNQTVSQGLYSGPFENATLTLSADWFNDDSNRNITDSYSMTVEAWDIDHNPVGTATYNSEGRHNWENKSVTLTPTGSVSYITVSFSGIDNGYWAGDYGPHLKNPSLRISHGQMVTETTYEEVTTTEEVTEMVEETYYTTEPIPASTGLTVKVYNQLNTSNPQRSDTAYNLCKTTTLTSINHNWGGGDILGCGGDRVMIHYTGYLTPTENITSLLGQADDGFFMSLNGTTVINNWTLKGCGGNWNPVSLEAGKTYEIDAWFFEWGGGACSILNYQSNNGSGVVPEAWYTNAASTPMIKNPDLLPAVEESQANYDLALSNKQSAELTFDEKDSELNNAVMSYSLALVNKQEALDNLGSAQSVMDSAVAMQNDSQNLYNAELAKQTVLETSKAEARNSVSTATDAVTTAQTDLDIKTQTVATAQAVKDTTFQNLSTEQANLTAASSSESVALATKSQAEDTVVVKQQLASTSLTTASTKAEVISFTEVETTIETPPEEGSKEIPADLSAENLMSVDLTAVDPTELTVEQAEQLKEVALETFLTAEAGSPEYEQALDALYLAAEQDDIELSPELAAIPGLAGAVELVNFFGNAGADMSPKVREDSKKVVVAGVVAVGAAVSSATGAATSAASSSSSGSGSGSSTRRKQ
jgi:flagellar biosynthesis chaperone FliJ